MSDKVEKHVGHNYFIQAANSPKITQIMVDRLIVCIGADPGWAVVEVDGVMTPPFQTRYVSPDEIQCIVDDLSGTWVKMLDEFSAKAMNE